MARLFLRFLNESQSHVSPGTSSTIIYLRIQLTDTVSTGIAINERF